MNVRAPDIRHPRTFYDVFGTVAAGVTLMAIVLTLWHGTFIRVEMAVLLAALCLWAIWAVSEILERSAEAEKAEKRWRRRPR
ncbi:hypothetical protein ACFQGT_14745 [Natrialbaceae archaeon GCM10025810]|uniref:hypothetical protein n=1 Tax=Halovalidus salilacus TaxID=3075124 RepID=UPI003615A128